MKRKVDYYKSGFEMIKVTCTRDGDEYPCFNVAIHFGRDGEIQALSSQPLKRSFSITEVSLELHKLWSFVQERAWRSNLSSYSDYADNIF